MIKTMVTTALLCMSVSVANAQSVMGTVTKVEANYVEQSIGKPVHNCYTTEVPIYGYEKKQDNTGNIIGGAIIGGVLGNQIGKGNGAAGAVIGGLIGNAHGNSQQQVVIGYRTEERCTSKMVYETQTRIKNYRIHYEWAGLRGTFYSQQSFNVGDSVNLNVHISKN